MKEIEVIAYFDTEGNIRPYRFRIAAEDESLTVIDIDRIINVHKRMEGAPIGFTCECIIHEQKKIFDIVYFIRESKWYLKM